MMLARRPTREIRAGDVVLCIFVLYVGSYLVLMDPRYSAIDMEAYRRTDMAACRFVRLQESASGASVVFPPVTWVNYVYWPIDWARVHLLHIGATHDPKTWGRLLPSVGEHAPDE